MTAPIETATQAFHDALDELLRGDWDRSQWHPFFALRILQSLALHRDDLARVLYETDPASASDNTAWDETGMALGGRPVRDYYYDQVDAVLAFLLAEPERQEAA